MHKHVTPGSTIPGMSTQAPIYISERVQGSNNTANKTESEIDGTEGGYTR